MSELVPVLAEFMTIEKLAAELGRNKRTLDRWDALGIGPPRTRMGRTVLYRRSSVQKWLSALSPIPRERESVLNADIVSVGHALFRNTPGQTFRVVK